MMENNILVPLIEVIFLGSLRNLTKPTLQFKGHRDREIHDWLSLHLWQLGAGNGNDNDNVFEVDHTYNIFSYTFSHTQMCTVCENMYEITRREWTTAA